MSRIKVDALQGTSGSDTAITLSGANATVGGTLAVTGVHTIGNNAVYTSDVGTVTQNIVESLVKTWWRYNISNNTLGDSFNTSSSTDDGTGLYTIGIANDFSSADLMSASAAGSTSSGGIRETSIVSYGAGSIQCTIAFQNGGGIDADGSCVHLCGSLA